MSAAARALLRVDTRSDAAQVLQTAICDLGGRLVALELAAATALPVDVSLGVGEPLLVEAGPAEPVRERLRRHLPRLLDDALVAAGHCDRYERQTVRAALDTLTGVARRDEIEPRLGRAVIGDVVALLDLDGFKQVNDTLGHAAGDDVLRRFGALLRSRIRDADFIGRYGGDEFLLIFAGVPELAATQRLRELASVWAADTRQATQVSIGMASVGEGGAVLASLAADRALLRAKRLGKNRLETALPEDFSAPLR